MERQWWLLKAERQAIQELRKEKNVLNEAEPEFVETPDALLELERKREAKDKVETKRVRSERRAIKILIGALDHRLAPLLAERASCLSEIKQREEVLRKSKSVLAFLFGRRVSESIPQQEARLAILRKKLVEIESVVAPDLQEQEELSERYRILYFDFPKVNRRFWQRP